MESITIVKCPQCGAQVPWTTASVYRPFCSQRCQLIDLGAWAQGSYHIASVDDDSMSEERPVN